VVFLLRQIRGSVGIVSETVDVSDHLSIRTRLTTLVLEFFDNAIDRGKREESKQLRDHLSSAWMAWMML